MIDLQTQERIKEAADIVDVVSEFVTLRRSGSGFKGLCPFHNERTPSFHVNRAKGIFMCFGCHKGGDATKFIMEHEQMSYPEALKWLAKRYGIEVKERELTDDERRQENERESMYIVNEWAAGYFNNILKNDPDGIAIGKQYFRSRGFRDDTIEKFKLGFAPVKSGIMSEEALSKGYKKEFLVKTGLCYQRDDGTLYDRFCGRVIFPWFSVSGKICAFGGRVLDSRTKGVNQKYVNSPESDIYHKDHQLYGLFQAKRAIAKEDCVYMVEGYADVISMYQCGIENVVANSGTALSTHQIRTLHRFTSNIILLYDGDEAGIHAALRGTDMLLSEGMNVKIVLFPDNDDPDSYARKHTADQFRQFINDNQTDFITFKAHVLLRGQTDPHKRSEAVSSIVHSIAVIPDQIMRATYIRDATALTGLPEQTLISTMNQFIYANKNGNRNRNEDENNVTTTSASQPRLLQPLSHDKQAAKVEMMLIQLVIRHGGEIIYQDLEPDEDGRTTISVAQFIEWNFSSDGLEFSVPLYNRILHEASEHCYDDNFDSGKYFTNHEDPEISQLAIQMSMDKFFLSDSIQSSRQEMSIRVKTEHLVLDFRMHWVEQHLKDLRHKMLLSTGNEKRSNELVAEIQKMTTIRNNIAKLLGNNIIV
ncbi:MAG: DNA primase [Prevotella sp.]|nr:DNA primase [Prevotella sp.]